MVDFGRGWSVDGAEGIISEGLNNVLLTAQHVPHIPSLLALQTGL